MASSLPDSALALASTIVLVSRVAWKKEWRCQEADWLYLKLRQQKNDAIYLVCLQQATLLVFLKDRITDVSQTATGKQQLANSQSMSEIQHLPYPLLLRLRRLRHPPRGNTLQMWHSYSCPSQITHSLFTCAYSHKHLKMRLTEGFFELHKWKGKSWGNVCCFCCGEPQEGVEGFRKCSINISKNNFLIFPT